MLDEKELKTLKGMENKERWKILVYTMLGIGIGYFSVLIGIGFILIILIDEEGSKILGFAWVLSAIVFFLVIPAIGIREQLKLFRIIKKLQKELEGNQQETHTPVFKTEENVMLNISELKKLKQMEKAEGSFFWGYIFLGIVFSISVLVIIVGSSVKNNNLILAVIATCLLFLLSLLFMSISLKGQLKLFGIIKKLQKELEENKQATSSTEIE